MIVEDCFEVDFAVARVEEADVANFDYLVVACFPQTNWQN